MSITKRQVLENLDEVKQYINEIEAKPKIKEYTKEDLIELLKTNVDEFNRVVALKEDGGEWENLPKRDDRLDLSGADLRGANLSGADLSEVNLSGANLSEANLSGANLSEADFHRSQFWGKSNCPKTLKKNQVEKFLLALGFEIKD